MININIISPIADLFKKQLASDWETKGYRFCFNSKEDIIWDSVVVYENIHESYNIKCRKEGLFFISGEPPIVKVYTQAFINLFDHIISSHNLKHSNNHRDQQALPWFFGYNFKTETSSYSFDQISQMDIPQKEKVISFITSNRTFLPGHKNRLNWMKELQSLYKEKIDFYGKGIQQVDDKANALLPYKFSICIENSCVNDYWTEKIADAILAYSIPIYYGCKNIESYFPKEAMIAIDIKDKIKSMAIMNEIVNNHERLYQEKLPFLIEARNRLLFKYNLFPFIKSYIDKYVDLTCEDYKNVSINPYDSYPKDWKQETLLKTKRVIRKLF